MAQIDLLIEIATRNTIENVVLPDDLPATLLVLNLIEQFYLPTVEGLAYILEYPRLQRLFGENETLKAIGIQPNETITILPRFSTTNDTSPFFTTKIIQGFSQLGITIVPDHIEAAPIKSGYVPLLMAALTATTDLKGVINTNQPTRTPPRPLPLQSFSSTSNHPQESPSQGVNYVPSLPARQPIFHHKPNDSATTHSKKIQIASTYEKLLRHLRLHFFEDLLPHDFEDLWKLFAYADAAQDRIVLTGYGRFGGTTLIKLAMEKARHQLEQENHTQGAFLGIRFAIDKETPDSFEVWADSLTISHPNMPSELKKSMHWPTLQDGDSSNTIEIPLSDGPLGVTFFDLADTAIHMHSESTRDYKFPHFITDINMHITQMKSEKNLHGIVARFIGDNSLSTRLTIVIDRVQYVETFRKLTQSDLFNNQRTRIIMIVRKEDYNRWNISDQQLRAAGLEEWYICPREDNFFQKLFDINISHTPDIYHYLNYRVRGSIGSMLQLLRDPQHVYFGNDHVSLKSEELLRRNSVLHDSWLQQLLELNWDFLFGNSLVGKNEKQQRDRARFGIYSLLDWINDLGRRFSLVEVLKAATDISQDIEIVKEILQRVLLMLLKNTYLKYENERYCVVWTQQSNKKPRKIRFPKRVIESDDGLNIKKGLDEIPDSAIEKVDKLKGGTPEKGDHRPDTVFRSLLEIYFSDGEFRSLCSDLGITYDNLPGRATPDKMRELVAYVKRHGKQADLLAKCKQLRSHVPDWPDLA